MIHLHLILLSTKLIEIPMYMMHTRLPLFEEKWNKVSLLNRMIWPSSEVINQNFIKSTNDKCFQMLRLLTNPHMKSAVKCLTFAWCKCTGGSIFCDLILCVGCWFYYFHLFIGDTDPRKTAQCVGKSLTACHQYGMACCTRQTIPTNDFNQMKSNFNGLQHANEAQAIC